MATRDAGHHFCPGCGVRLQFNSRYPWYFCPNCVAEARDAAGRKLVFSNVSFSGGLSWSYADDSERSNNARIHVVCLINERPVIVTEARFGGIVAQPVDEGFTYRKRRGGIDLTQRGSADRADIQLSSELQTKTLPDLILPKDWYTYIVAEGAEEGRPGIYEWQIEGAGIYIGKFTRISRPTKQYAINVANLLNGKQYRPAKPLGFRPIHRELGRAVREGRKITLTILENVSPSDLNRRERELIAERGSLNVLSAKTQN